MAVAAVAAVAAVEAAVVIKGALKRSFDIALFVGILVFFASSLVLAEELVSEESQRIKKNKILSEAEKQHLKIENEKKKHKELVDNLIYRTGDIQSLLQSGKIKKSEIPDPHWKKESCQACHTEKLGKATVKNLRTTDYERSCMHCHADEFDHNYIHPVNIKPSKEKMKDMNPAMKTQLRISNGNIKCSTCHDITHQCRLDDLHRHENPKFFRNGPYAKRYELCVNCHKADKYQRFNPHDHVDDNGEIIESKCRVCHAGSIDELPDAESIDEVGFHLDEGLNAICWGCHKWKPHPGGGFSFFKSKSGPNHLVKPSEIVLLNIEKTYKEKNVLMPLEPGSGKVFCGTCHNPHAIGVINNEAAAKGAEAKSRLRSENICSNCHTK